MPQKTSIKSARYERRRERRQSDFQAATNAFKGAPDIGRSPPWKPAFEKYVDRACMVHRCGPIFQRLSIDGREKRRLIK